MDPRGRSPRCPWGTAGKHLAGAAPSVGSTLPEGTVRARWRRGARSARTRFPVRITSTTHPYPRIGLGPAPSGMGRITRLDYQDQGAGASLDFGPWRFSLVRPVKIARWCGFPAQKNCQRCVDLAWPQRFGIDICRGESRNATPDVPCGPTPAPSCCALVTPDRQPRFGR